MAPSRLSRSRSRQPSACFPRARPPRHLPIRTITDLRARGAPSQKYHAPLVAVSIILVGAGEAPVAPVTEPAIPDLFTVDVTRRTDISHSMDRVGPLQNTKISVPPTYSASYRALSTRIPPTILAAGTTTGGGGGAPRGFS